MSDSTHATKNEDGAAARPARREGRWFAYSVAVHAAVLLALWFTPVCQMILQQQEPETPKTRLTPEQMERIVEKVRESEELQARQELQQMLLMEQQMRLNLQQSVQQYQEQSEQHAADAPQTAMDLQQQMQQAMEQALNDAQWAAEKLQQAMDTPPDPQAATDADKPQLAALTAAADRKEAGSVQQDVIQAQATAQEAQREIAQALAFLDPNFQPTQQAQQEANTAQQQAAQAQDLARETLRELGNQEKKLSRDQQAVPQLEQAMQKDLERSADAAKRAEQLAAEVADLQQQVEQKQQDVSAAAAAAATARQALEEVNATAAAATELKQAQSTVTSAERAAKLENDREKRLQDALARAEQRQAEATKQAEQHQTRAADLQQKAEEKKADIAATQQAVAQLRQGVVTTQQAAVDAQKAAIEAQSKATQNLEKSVADAVAAQAAELPPATQQALQAQEMPATAQMDLAELYQAAVATEQRVAEMYRQVRAADAAVASDAPLAQTLAQTQTVATTRPEIDAELLRQAVRSQGQAEAHRDEVAKVARELKDMNATLQRLGALAGQGSSASGSAMSVALTTGSSSSGSAGGAAQSALQALQQMAAADEPQRYEDLSAVMRSAAGAGVSAGSILGPGDLIRPSPKVPAARRIGARPTGRAHPGWVYVDTWYVIGPFANPNRRHIDTRFPPESVIDLDGVYSDDSGRQLRWIFQQSPLVRLRPQADEPYAIFYLYSEVWCETDMDLNIAIGSDDYSQVWINGLPVWSSGKEHKSWRPDEGYRTVFFQQGINRILVRLENGQYSCAMSLMINLQPEAAP